MVSSINPSHARPLLIFSQSDYFIQIADINSHPEWRTVQIQISWLLQKPTDLDLHCLQGQGISGFSRTRVKQYFVLRNQEFYIPSSSLSDLYEANTSLSEQFNPSLRCLFKTGLTVFVHARGDVHDRISRYEAHPFILGFPTEEEMYC